MDMGRTEEERERESERRRDQEWAGEKAQRHGWSKTTEEESSIQAGKTKTAWSEKSNRDANCGRSIDQRIDRWINRSNRRQWSNEIARTNNKSTIALRIDVKCSPVRPAWNSRFTDRREKITRAVAINVCKSRKKKGMSNELMHSLRVLQITLDEITSVTAKNQPFSQQLWRDAL